MRSQAELKTDIVYGVHAVLEVLKAKKRRVLKVYTTQPEPQAFGPIKTLLVNQKIPLVYKERALLTQLAGGPDHQAVVAVVMPYVFRAKPFDPQKQPCVILLDGVMDVRNVGAIIRSAYCAGFSGVIMPRKSTAPLNAAAFKSSAGLAEHMQISQPASTSFAVNELQKAGYKLYVTALSDKAQDATAVQYGQPLCVVIGSEGAGVSRELLNKGTVIKLAQRTADISYNASVAAGIVLFLIAQQQKLIS